MNNDGYYHLNEIIQKSLNENSFFKHLFTDILYSGLEKSKKYQPDKQLTLYEKYTRKDVCKLLNWHNDESSTMYGYKTKHLTCPIFVIYHKDDDVDSSVAYGDEFISSETFKWYTRSNRTLQYEEVHKIINAVEKKTISTCL